MKQLLIMMMVLCLCSGMLSGCNKYGHGYDDPEHDPAQFQDSK